MDPASDRAATTEGAKAPRIGKRLALAAVATLGALAAVEGYFRARAWTLDRQVFTAEDESSAPIPAGTHVSLGQMIRLSGDDRIVYELIPNLDVIFNGERVRTNASGFRSPECATAKLADTFRVIGLGDSFLFGWSLPDGADYLSLLGGMLDERMRTNRCEVINTAVPGYNTVNAVATLEAKGLAYVPDLVVLGLVGNDLDLPTFLRTPRDVLDPSRSFLVDALRGASDRAALELAAPREGADRGFERDPERVPKEHRHLVGWEPFRSALERLATLSREQGFSVAVVFLSPKRRTVIDEGLDLARELGFLVVDLGPTFEDYLSQHGEKRFRGSALSISAEDSHPSATAHRIAAEALYAALTREGLLPELR
jgi:hypothetical protein